MKEKLLPYQSLKLVLAFSGGPDSWALYKAAKKGGLSFVLAHVDHGWRAESAQEASFLKAFAEREGVPFYLKTFSKSDFQGNLEEAGRLKRLEFFKEVAEKTGASGVLMGHHAGDAGETSLKRLLEGAPFWALEALKKESEFEGLLLIRPFLELPKEEILDYVKGEPYFLDPTNFTGEYLRGRMRQEMIPFLSEQLGKNVSPALSGLSHQAAELQECIEELSLNYPWIEGLFGGYIDFSSPPPIYILKALIHRLYKRLSLSVSKEEIAALALALKERKSGFVKEARGKEVRGQKIVADRGVLFVLKDLDLKADEWRLSYKELEGVEEGWRAAFQGRVAGWVPQGELTLAFQRRAFDKIWTGSKVPSFMRERVPVVLSQGVPVAEFLSGRGKKGWVRVALLAPLN